MAIAERIVQPDVGRADPPARTPVRLGGRAAARTADGRLARVGERATAAPVRRGTPAPRRDDISIDAPRTRAPRTIRTRRPTSVGLRAHLPGGLDGRGTARAERIAVAGPRPMPRATLALELDADRETPLRLVPRRRRAARFAGVLCALVVLTMLAAASFQTQLARRQVQLDQLDGDISAAREQYDTLRRERAELRSPSRLSAIATEIGMVTATETDFIVMSPDVLAEVERSMGSIGADETGSDDDTLEQFRSVKAITDATP